MASANKLTIDAATRMAQAEASNPRGSAWVSANAGSGKTFVLARRVVRLLLAGTDPSRILCLTFTKAAAAQMAQKVFEQLGRWATLPDATLAKELAEIEGHRPDAGELARARRLFARALETPGGLKIQTIHAFCERLLHLFPFEANVAGHFEVLDEQTAATLVDSARREVLADAAADGKGPLGRALTTVLASASDFMHELAIAEFIRERDRLRAWIVAAGSLDAALDQLRDRLGLARGETPEALRTAIIAESVFSAADLARLLALLQEGGKADRDAAGRLAPVLSAIEAEARIGAYLDFCQTSGGELRVAAKLVTKAIKDRWSGLEESLVREFARLETLLDRLAAAECHASTAAMVRLADAAVAAYERMKVTRGALDFNDLIVKTMNLLARADAGHWVHYKLDRGLDHVLVDEAQDTSPRQWSVIRALVEEFFAGEGARDTTRTLFAVGDEKQSIFSFQGAAPAWFSRMRGELGERAKAGGYPWSVPELHLSFRSVPIVLEAVDAVFARQEVFASLSTATAAPVHVAARRELPGRVVVWPMIEPPAKQTPADWTTPLDHLGEKSPEVQLANRIARTIAGWLYRNEKLDTGQAIRPGGILILARTRGAQTDAINRALKTQGVPIAGADRLALTEHIAVMDLVALGRVMLLPEDDLSLAALLKSPLFGFGEDDLFRLAHARSGSLWDALAGMEAPPFVDARRRLESWRNLADYLDPYAFFARILGPERGRHAFLKRLGAEAEDVLDEFLAQAIAYEKANVPSLEGFLFWLDTAETAEIKRDTDQLRDEVRVMTVHGAKGLEADIVFLVDTGAQPVHPNHDPKVVPLDGDGDGGPLVWMRRLKAMPRLVDARVRALRDERYDEYLRLLYVAMTRAKDCLYVCGTLKERGTDLARGWHGLVKSALEPGSRRIERPDGTLEALEWRPGSARKISGKTRQETLPLRPVPPPWLAAPAPAAPVLPSRVTPSTALSSGGEAEFPATRLLPGRGDAETMTALERGRIVHRLLQSLPDLEPAHRGQIAERYLAATAPAWTEADRAALVGSVLSILDDGRFAPVFAPGSRAEIDVAGLVTRKSGEAALSGRIDRLAVAVDRVLIVDYKTNRPAPASLAEVPAGYIAQLSLYRALLQKLYPERLVAAAILWTDSPALMEIPSAALDAAVAGMTEN